MTKTVRKKVRGLAYYPALRVPKETYAAKKFGKDEREYCIQVDIDSETADELKQFHINVKESKFNEGLYTIRASQSEFNNKTGEKTSIRVLDAKMNPIDIDIGNGSEVVVGFAVSSEAPKAVQYNKAYLKGVQVLNLVEFKDDFFEEEEGFVREDYDDGSEELFSVEEKKDILQKIKQEKSPSDF